MSVRDYARNYLPDGSRRPAAATGRGAIGSDASSGSPPGLGTHALDGPEHTDATGIDRLLATIDHAGLMPPLSGNVADVYRGDGSVGPVEGVGPEIPADHGDTGSTETIDLSAGAWHRMTLDDDVAVTVSGFTVDEAVVEVVKVMQDGTGAHAVAWDGDVLFAGDDQPDQAADSVTWFLLWSDEGDDVVYGARIGGSGAAAITVKDEGSDLTAAPASIDFAGAGVTATAVGDDVTVTIPGTPTGAAGGDLSGTYPNPSVVDDSHSHTAATLPAVASGSDHAHVMDVLFSGDGSTTVFNLPASPVDAYSVTAYVAGVQTEVALSGSMLDVATFGSAPGAASNNVRFDIVAATL